VARHFKHFQQGNLAVADYIGEFNNASAPIHNLPKLFLIDFFVAGLRGEVFEEIKNHSLLTILKS